MMQSVKSCSSVEIAPDVGKPNHMVQTTLFVSLFKKTRLYANGGVANRQVEDSFKCNNL